MDKFCQVSEFKVDIYFPSKSIDNVKDEKNNFLIQVLLPHISTGDKNNEIRNFFKAQAIKNKKIIQLDSSYQNEFIAKARFNSILDRKEHLKFFQSLTQEQKAAMSPYARLLLVPNPSVFKGDMEASAIPLSFSKAFDLDFFLNKNKAGNSSFDKIKDRVGNNVQSPFRPQATPIESNSRGELAALQSLTVNRIYNQTAMFEPIKVNMNFYFSSFDVFAYKPAIETESYFGINFQNFKRLLLNNNFTFEPSDVRYTELITLDLPKRPVRLVLEYGWNVSPTVSSKLLSQEQKKLIEKFEKSYFMLSPQDHNINFNEDGSFTLSVEYETVEYETLKRTSDYKTALLKNQEIYKIVSDKLDSNEKQKIERYYELKKQIDEEKDINKRVELEGQQSNIEKSISEFSTGKYMKLFQEYFNKKKLIYKSRFVSISEGEGTNLATVLLQIERAGSSIEVQKTYNYDEIKEQLRQKLKKQKVSFIDEHLQKTYPKAFEVMSEADKRIDFILLKDFVAFCLDLSGSKEVPHIIFDNIALQKEDGGRYWCNLGDIPLDFTTFTNTLVLHLKTQPNANLIDLLHYILQDIIPKQLSNGNGTGANPQISFPRLPFNFLKWEKNNTNENYRKLLNGDKKYLTEFCREYCSGITLNDASGCLVVTQTPSLNFMNSRLFIGRDVRNAERTNFLDFEKLLESGVMRLVVGASDGVLQKLNFNSNKEAAITNIAIEKQRARSNTPQSLLVSTFQYTLSATLFGNRAYDFTNLVYVPAAGIGYSPRIDGGSNKNYSDFQLGGLYLILSATDTMNLDSGLYTKTINASCQSMESELAKKIQKAARNNTAINPNNEPNISIVNYLITNNDKIITGFGDLKELNLIDDPILDNPFEQFAAEDRARQAREDAAATAALEASGAPKDIGGGKQVDSDGVIRSTNGFAPLKTGIGSSF